LRIFLNYKPRGLRAHYDRYWGAEWRIKIDNYIFRVHLLIHRYGVERLLKAHLQKVKRKKYLFFV